MLPEEMRAKVRALLDDCRAKDLHLATAESCTGGMIAAALTEIAGSSDVFERGFVTYQNEAKEQSNSPGCEAVSRFSVDRTRNAALGEKVEGQSVLLRAG